MKRISDIIICIAIVLWTGSAVAHTITWPPNAGDANFLSDLTKNRKFSGYWLGQHQSAPQLMRTWVRTSWVPESGNGEPQYYLQFWPRDSRWHNMESKRSIVKNFFETNPIPEPATMLLLGAGLLGLARTRMKSNRK